MGFCWGKWRKGTPNLNRRLSGADPSKKGFIAPVSLYFKILSLEYVRVGIRQYSVFTFCILLALKFEKFLLQLSQVGILELCNVLNSIYNIKRKCYAYAIGMTVLYIHY